MVTDGGERARTALWTRADTIAFWSIVAGAGLIRLARLGDPPDAIFDETYYAKDSCWYVRASTTACDLDTPPNEVHPPLGKWLIALGIRIFTYDSFGWRIASVVAGTLTVALVYLLARRLLNSMLGASFAAGLLALDLLHFVQSRVAMLDIFLPLFAVAAFLFLVYDRDRLSKSSEAATSRDGPFARPWLLAAGAAGGAAVATKWSGGFILLAVAVVAVAWEISARRSTEFVESRGSQWPKFMLSFVVLPAVIYLVTYIGRLDGDLIAVPWGEASWFRALWDHHRYMFDFHTDLEATHSYQSPGWSWLLLKRPVSYFFNGDGGRNREIMATGNPFVWWLSILALAFVALRWVRQRDFRRPEGLILAGFALTYLPWLTPLFGRSAVFIFYLLPAIPFMCLALAYVATEIGKSWEARAAQTIFALGAAATFVFYFPIVAKVAITPEEWDRRIWVFDECDPPKGVPTTTTVTTTVGSQIETTVTETTTTESLPPPGWCWI